jgi:hypothetical protein
LRDPLSRLNAAATQQGAAAKDIAFMTTRTSAHHYARDGIWISMLLAALLAIGTEHILGADKDTPRTDAARVALAVDKFMVVDCLLPGQVRRIGTRVTYLTPRRPVKIAAGDCEVRGGEYVAYDRSRLDSSLSVWLPMAKEGDKEAQTYVGEIYEKGIGGSAPDYVSAAHWYQKAAAQAYPRAMINLGFLYEQGLGVKKDMQAALSLYRKASGLGDLIKLEQASENASAQRDAELNSLRRELESTKQQLDKARQELQRHREDTQSELDKLKIQQQQAQSAGNLEVAKGFETQAKNREQEIEEQRQEVSRLEKIVDAYHAQLKRQEAESSTLLSENKQLQEHLATATRDLDARKVKAAEDQRALDELKNELNHLKEQASSTSQAKDHAKQLEAQIKHNEGDVERQRQDMAQLEKTVEAYRDQLQRAQAEAGNLRTQLEEARLQLTSTNAELDARKAAAAEDQKALDALKSELDKLKRESSTQSNTGERVKQLQAELTQKEDQLAGQRKDITRLETNSERLKGKLEQLEKEKPVPPAPAKDGVVAIAPPSIQLIDPPLLVPRGPAAIKVRGAALTREIVGRIVAPAGILSFTVNDRTEKVDAGGMFKAQVVLLQKSATPVSLAAVDAQGRRAALDFSLVPEELAERFSKPPLSSFDPKDFGKYHALVIGNAQYAHLPKLDTAAEDATAVAEVLAQKYGFKVTKLINATRYQILSELNKLRGSLTEKDNLMIYYAGHGELDRANLRGHWLPVDAESDSDANWISSVAITDILNAMAVKHVLVVADSCYSGAMTRNSIGQLEPGMTDEARASWLRALAKARCRAVLTSGGVQPVIDGGGGKHSVFAKSFLDVLQENQEPLEAQRLYREVAARVLNLTQKLDIEQKPEYAPLRFAGHESGDFIFIPVN